MHKLEDLIDQWRKTLTAGGHVEAELLEELEGHLRDHIDEMVRTGMPEAQAFHQAVSQLGPISPVASEFLKLSPRLWMPIKGALVGGCVTTLGLVIALINQVGHKGNDMLLVSHVFTVVLGYVSAFLLGGLGLCFVLQRCFSTFSPMRLRSLSRASRGFAIAALILTTAGVVLGAIWAKLHLGRAWSWDPKELGGVSVVLWLLFYLVAQKFAWFNVLGQVRLAILGNVVVLLGWFGSNLVSNLSSYGAAVYGSLAVGIVLNLAGLLVGFLPVGILHSGKRPIQ